jgi:hypothetical protein
VTRRAIHTTELSLFIILQANIDMVKMERDVDIGEEDCINIKTEEVYRPSVCIIKTEYEVSTCFVFCGSDLFTHLCTCITRAIFITVLILIMSD